MSASKHFDKICCIVLCFTLVITLLFMNAESFGVSAANRTMGYENRLFDTSKVHTIDIVMDDWEDFLSTCTNEEYSVCSVVIDGEVYKNVGIRAKGNTSLSSVASYGNDRYSFKIEFDQYDSIKSYHGLDKLSLNNIIQDTTYMKDYLVYQMMGQFGAAAPLCSYAYITVNGEDFGLYLAVEAVEDGFLTRNYGSDYGDLYKPDSMSMGGGRGNGKDFDREDMEEMFEGFGDMNPFGNSPAKNSDTKTDADSSATPDMGDMQMPEGGETPEDGTSEEDTQGGSSDKKGSFSFGGMGGFGFGGNDVSLVYSDDDYSSYSNIFGNAKTTVTDADKDRLIASLKQMNEAIDIKEVVNVEEVIRYFVVHNFAVNFDSYTGSMIHNYYLYEEDGVMEMIPWDYNLAFGTFQGSSDATSLVNYPIDTPVSGGDVSSRPMLAWIFSNEEYKELYHQYFAEFLSMFYENGTLEEIIDSVSEMIAPYIEKQPKEFYTYEEFQTGIATLKEFCALRLESIEGQLNGTIPATSSGQSADNSALIDGSGIKVSDMGSFGGGRGFGGGFGGGNRNANNGGGFSNFGDGNRGNKSESDNRSEKSSDGTSSDKQFWDNPKSKKGNEKPKAEDTNDTPTKEPLGDYFASSGTIMNMSWGDGMTFPDMGNMQIPDMSQFGDGSTFPDMGNMPWGDMFGGDSSSDDTKTGDTSSDAENTPSAEDGTESNRSNRPNTGSVPGFDRNSMSGNYASDNNPTTTLLLLGISVLVLAGGLIFAILYGRKRY